VVCTIGSEGCPYAVAMAFGGFPADAFGFYERLEADNSRRFWDAHKTEYQRCVREPMAALGAELEAEFGPATIFRPHRDIRFSADKSPYKTYQGAFVERLAGTGFYVQVSADGMLASGGFHSHGPDQVERYRAAVDADRTGKQLASIVAALRQDGLAIGGDQLKTRPRGVTVGHPRLELLRHRSLTASRDWPPGPLLHDRQALSLVRQTWTQLIPLCDWLSEHVGPPGGMPAG
jgi:uncharacterized protein (TIGR02453 family)